MRRFLVAALFAGLAPFVTARIMGQTSAFDKEIRQQMLMRMEEPRTDAESVQVLPDCDIDCVGIPAANQDCCTNLDEVTCLSEFCADCGCVWQGPTKDHVDIACIKG